MKKTKFLVLALALAVMLVGAGYAYWTETLSVKGTVATGKLEVMFKDISVATKHDPELEEEPDCYVDGDTIEFTVGNMHPGAYFDVYATIENTGTIKAKLLGIEDITSGSKWLNRELKVSGSIFRGPFATPFKGWDDLKNHIAELDRGESVSVKLTFTLNPDLEYDQLEEKSFTKTFKLLYGQADANIPE
ncbi:MAG: hypothetical protein GX957_07420 [Clostridiaceae bacterium]|nr:hypothetical protein [Clostridiaceae bacterium]